MRSFIDSALAGRPLAVLVAAASAFIAVAFLQQGLSILTNYLGDSVAWSSTNDLSGETAAHALGLDMRFHNDTTPGRFIERIHGDITEMANFFSFFAIQVATNVLMLFGILLMLFRDIRSSGAIGYSVRKLVHYSAAGFGFTRKTNFRM